MIVPLILCGGSGTRLWPASRADRPKQFLPLFEGRSTFRMTLERVADPELFGRPVVIAAHAHRFLAAEDLEAAGVDADVLLEPEPRESGPAVLAGASFAAAREGGDALVLSLAADHVIRDVAGFRSSVRTALGAARGGRLVTFGIVPDHPATGFGYLEPGEALGDGVAAVRRFVEKPDAEAAADYVRRGFLWNSGNLLFRAKSLGAAYEAVEPATAAAVAEAVRAARTDLGFIRLDAAAFGQADKRSLDHAVLERSDAVALVPAAFDWSDVGSWSAVRALAAQDEAGNAATGPARFLAASRNVVASDGATVAVVGLDDLAVVATPDAILVARRDDAAGVRRLVEMLSRDTPRLTRTRDEDFRPWGRFRTLHRGEGCQVRRIVVKPGRRLSLQVHRERAEHWIVTRGEALVTLGDEQRRIGETESIRIPPGAVHRLENAGAGDLEIIEVQSGASFGEDDVTRLDDED